MMANLRGYIALHGEARQRQACNVVAWQCFAGCSMERQEGARRESAGRQGSFNSIVALFGYGSLGKIRSVIALGTESTSNTCVLSAVGRMLRAGLESLQQCGEALEQPAE